MMLFVFGYMVEPFFKAAKFLFIYIGAGIFGMVLVTMAHQPGTQTVILGASGSTMALMGAYIAILLKQNSRSSVKLRKQQLIFLFIFILVQSRIDYISPQISFTAHISGLVFGLISAYIFLDPGTILVAREAIQQLTAIRKCCMTTAILLRQISCKLNTKGILK